MKQLIKDLTDKGFTSDFVQTTARGPLDNTVWTTKVLDEYHLMCDAQRYLEEEYKVYVETLVGRDGTFGYLITKETILGALKKSIQKGYETRKESALLEELKEANKLI